MMLAVLSLPLLAGVVRTADYALASKYRADLQALADSVALASVNELKVSEAAGKAAGVATYQSGLLSLGLNIVEENLKLDLDSVGDLASHVEITVTFEGLFGKVWTFKPEVVFVTADAELKSRTFELSVATDLSPSMDNTEVKALVSAVRTLATDVFSKASEVPVRMAYAPFTRNVALPSYASAWVSGTGTSTPGRLCVGPRSTSLDATDATPSAAIFPAFAESATYCPPEIMQPLTADKAEIDAVISSVELRKGPYRGTGVYEGLSWSYRILSPDWKGFWPEAATPASYAKAKKIALIMTDGFNDASVGYTKTVADKITLEACDNMKKDGIEIYFVTFKVTADLVALYEKCATSPAHLIDSADETQLQSAFNSITKRMFQAGPVLTN